MYTDFYIVSAEDARLQIQNAEELLAIVDEKGLVVPGAAWGISDGIDVSNTKVVRQSLAGKNFHTIEAIDKLSFCTLYAVPVTVDGLVVGVVLCGYD